MNENLHIKVVCQLCGDTSEVRTGQLVYPAMRWYHDELATVLYEGEAEIYKDYEFYLCPDCLEPYIEDSGPDGIYYDWNQLGPIVRNSLGLEN